MRLRSTRVAASEARVNPARTGKHRDTRLGASLVETGAMTAAQLESVNAQQRDTGRSFSDIAIEHGIDRSAVDRVGAGQHDLRILDAPDDRIDPAVVAAFDPHDPLARSARDLRRQIANALDIDGQAAKGVALISVDAATETSLVIANLAVSCAQADYRTLLVDANIDQPMLHGLFRLANHTGLSTMLTRSGELADYVQPCAISGLSIMTSGPPVANASELLERTKLFASLRGMADNFDIVLVDAGRIQAAELHVVDGADGAFVVIRRNASRMNMFQDVIDRLAAQQVAVIGSAFID